MKTPNPNQVLELCDQWNEYFNAHWSLSTSIQGFPITRNFRQNSQALQDWAADHHLQGASDFTNFIKEMERMKAATTSAEKGDAMGEAQSLAVRIRDLIREIRGKVKELLKQAPATTGAESEGGAGAASWKKLMRRVSDSIELKPGWGGISIDLKSLLGRKSRSNE